MPKQPKRPTKSAIELRLPVAATPERVAAAARMFQRAVAAFGPELSPDSVTMVVGNFTTTAGLRAWSADGHAALTHIENVIRDPLTEIRARPASQLIADAIARGKKDLAKYRGEFVSPGTKRRPVVVDERFFNMIEGAAKAPLESQDRIRGKTEVLSVVYRVGRSEESKDIAARINIDGTPRDITVRRSDDLIRCLFDAARDVKMTRLTLEAQWLRDGDSWTIDPRNIRIIAVDDMSPMNGADLLHGFAGIVSTVSDDELRETLDTLKGEE